MMGSMLSHEARDGHAERDSLIEARVRAECEKEIASLKTDLRVEMIAHLSFTDLLEKENQKQAALIEQLASALSVSEEFVDRHSEAWYLSGQSDLKLIRDALKAVEEWRKK